MSSHRRALTALLALASLAGCDRAVVRFGEAHDLVADPELLDFGVVFVGVEVERGLTLRNGGAAGVDVVVRPSASGAAVEVVPEAVHIDAGAEVELRVTWRGEAWGEQSGALWVEEAGAGAPLEVGLVALVQVDADADGYGSVATGGEDCDDTDAAVNPDAEERWYDGVDQDCAGDSDDDQDGDGVVVGKDCDDTDATAAIPSEELWNARDDDCDGQVDDLEIGDAAGGVARGGWNAPLLGLPWTLSIGEDLLGDGGVDVVLGTPEGADGGAVWILPARALPGRDASIGDLAGASLRGDGGAPMGYLAAVQRDVTGGEAGDLLVGAADLDGRGEGRVWLVPGGDALGGDAGIEDRAWARFVGDSSQDMPRMGVGLDLDGDGTAEIAVGAPYDQYNSDDEPTAEYTGNVSIYQGLSSGGEHELSDADVQIHGSRAAAFLGTGLVPTDLDADGYEDLLVSAPGDASGAAFAGAVYWIAGDPRLEYEERVDEAARARLVGDRANAYLGMFGVGRPGDNNGDGALDLAIASPADGEVSLWLGAGSLSGVHNALDGDLVWALSGDGCGTGLVADSDLDGDGADDLLVGCPFAAGGGSEVGEVHWLDPSHGFAEPAARAVLRGDHDRSWLGEWLLGGFDADGDGREDVLIGAPGDDGAGDGAGAVFLLSGP